MSRKGITGARPSKLQIPMQASEPETSTRFDQKASHDSRTEGLGTESVKWNTSFMMVDVKMVSLLYGEMRNAKSFPAGKIIIATLVHKMDS